MNVSSTFKGFGEVEKVDVSGFQFRKFGSLRQGEIEWFDNQSNKRLESLIPIYKLAEIISKDLEIADDVALGLIQGVGDNDLYQKVLLRYSTELLNVKKQSYTETDFQRDVCTMMLVSRVSKSFLRDNAESINEFFEIEIDVANPVWKTEFTNSLPLTLVAEIIEFTTNERTEWVTDKTKEDEEEVVSLGK